MTIENQPDDMAPDATLPGASSADDVAAESSGNEAGTFSPVAHLCNGILNAVNDLGRVPEPVQQTIAICIADILATFTEAERKVSTAKQKISVLKSSLRRAKDEIANLRKAKFGQSSERSIADGFDDDIDIFDGADLEEDEEVKEQSKGRRARKLPPTIETRVVHQYPANRTCCTCGCEMPSIGTEEATRLEIIPEHVVQVKEIRHRCACNRGICKEKGPVSAKSEHHLMKKRTLDLSVVIEAIAQKFFEHSTNYRMARRFQLQDLNVCRQTVGRNIMDLAKHLEPLCDTILDYVQAAQVAFMDETPLRVQSNTKGKGKCDTGYLWAFSRDESGWNLDAHPAVYFHYAPTRSGSVAKDLLADSSVEFLQTDGYSGYRALFEASGANQSLIRAGCVAHARRKFVEVQNVGKSPLARRVIARFKKIYDVEAEIRGCPPSVREAVRQEKSLPIMSQIKADLLANAANAEGNVKTAINYVLKSWEDFARFIFNGRIELDSNSIERCMRGIALTKKNSLFAGSHEAAKVWAIYYTLIETARMNGVNPRSYLNWVVHEIERKRGGLDYSQFMPWHCPLGRVAG